MDNRKPPQEAQAPEHTTFRTREDGIVRIEVHVAGGQTGNSIFYTTRPHGALRSIIGRAVTDGCSRPLYRYRPRKRAFARLPIQPSSPRWDNVDAPILAPSEESRRI